ncbi:MAG: hypothetical protein ABFS08_03205 [Pseudomonadota bacterium]
MNQSQIDQVKGHVDDYFSIDLSGMLANAYSESIDLNDVIIGQYSAKEFLSMSNKVFSQFREELGNSYIKALPFQYNFHNEYGNANLHQDLANYLAQVKADNFAGAITHLNRLVHYQAINGFWEKSKRKYFRVTEATLSEEKERIDLASKHLEKVSKDLNKFIDAITIQKDELSNFTHAKKKELAEIESLLDASRQHSNEISNLHTSATSLIEKINSLLEVTSEKKEESEELLLEARNSSKELLEIIKSYTTDIERQNKNYSKLETLFNESLSFIEGKKDYFEERNKYLDDLIGREVGASLFETFKQRKKELAPSVKFWKWSVPVMAIATIAWIFFLFGNGNISEITIEVFSINTLKTIPAIFLLLFSISQYSKERHFQEEYAFKSAVALTINAYADQLNDIANKDRLIMDSVSEIYKTPIDQPKHKEKDSKAAIETAKGLADVAKGLVNKH